MTPTELCVLFSGNVLAFILIWLAGLVREEQERQAVTGQARKKGVHSKELDVSGDRIWNVTYFLGLRG